MSIQLFILATLSFPPGWVSLAMMSILLFVYSCDPLFLLVELGVRRWAFDCLFILVTLSLLFSLLFVFMTLPLLPVWARLATMDTHCLFVCLFLLLSLIYLFWLRLVMMGNHCLFVLTTLSLLLGWVRLVTAGTQWVVILTTHSLLCFLKMSIHMFYLYKQFFDLCTSPCALFLYFQSTNPTVNACINKSQRWRCSKVCSTTVIFRFCMKFHFSSRTA